MLRWEIPSWCKESVTMYWFTNCGYLDGTWQFGPLYIKVIEASVQNPSNNLSQQAGEGAQDIEGRVLFTNEASIQLIQAGGQDSVFFVTSDGKRWFVTGWQKWDYLMPHYRVTLVGEGQMGFPESTLPTGMFPVKNAGNILTHADNRVLYRAWKYDAFPTLERYYGDYENTLRVIDLVNGQYPRAEVFLQ